MHVLWTSEARDYPHTLQSMWQQVKYTASISAPTLLGNRVRLIFTTNRDTTELPKCCVLVAQVSE